MSDLAYFWLLFQGATALWLGLYVLTRGGIQNRPWMMAMALGIWSLSPFSAVAAAAFPAPASHAWLRIIAAVLPIIIGFFFGVTLSLASEDVSKERKTAVNRISQGMLIAGFVLAVLCSSTNLVFDYRTAPTTLQSLLTNNFTTFGPLLPFYLTYTVATPLLLLLILLIVYRYHRQMDTPSQTEIVLIVWAAGAWLLGLMVRNVELLLRRTAVLTTSAPRTAVTVGGDLLFVAAILLLGWSIARHNAIIRGRVILRDFALSAFGFLLILLAYLVLPLLLNRFFFQFDTATVRGMGLFFVITAVFTHMLLETVRRQAASVVQPSAVARLQGEMSDLLSDSRQGTPLDQSLAQLEQLRNRTEIRQHIDKQLLRDLQSAEGHANLLDSPLLTLYAIRQQLPSTPTERQKISGLFDLLTKAVAKLEANPALLGRRGDEILQILRLRLDEGLDRAEITLRLHMHPRKYDRLLNQGLDHLADAVIELETLSHQARLQSSAQTASPQQQSD